MKKFILIFLMICSLYALNVVSAQDNATAGPKITSFTTSASSVNRDALEARTARVPVSWKSINRPVFANLVFEQILPDNSVINVELPRIIPWVNSDGDGIAAPILPAPDAVEVMLRVRLVNILDGRLYDERYMVIPIGTGGGAGSGVGSKPTITAFNAQVSAVDPAKLQAGTARVPVSWQSVNRPITATLVFEQLFPNGEVINVELPRDNPWVNPSDKGVVAPVMPDVADPTSIRLRVRMIDPIYNRVYDLRELTLPIQAAQPPQIRFFTVKAKEADSQKLLAGTERIPVSWQVDNRPENTNLVFEQILADGTAKNVELPRSFVIVPSSGDGMVAPVPPGGSETTVKLRLRLVDLSNNATLLTAEASVPITSLPVGIKPVTITTFTVSPQTVTVDGKVTITWAVEYASRVRLTAGVTVFDNLPQSGSVEVAVKDIQGQASPIRITLYAEGNEPGTSTTQERQVSLGSSSVKIRSFAANPTTAPSNGSVTLTWELEGATQGQITWVPDGTTGATATLTDVQTASGTFTAKLPDQFRPITFTLNVPDGSGVTVTQSITVETTCPYSYFVSDPVKQQGTCPESSPQSVEGAYQAFERGFMLWGPFYANTQTILVLYNDGTAAQFTDTWNGEDVIIDDIPPQGLIAPQRGFGKVWADNETVRTKLGWAKAVEQSFSTTYQVMERLSNDKPYIVYANLPDGRRIRFEDKPVSGRTWTYLP